MSDDTLDLAAERVADSPSREERLSIRASKILIEDLRRDADELGLSLSDYVRGALELVHGDDSLRRLRPPERSPFGTPSPAREVGDGSVAAQLAALTDAVSALSGALEEHIAAEEACRGACGSHEVPGGERPLTRRELEELLGAAVASLAAADRQALGQASERITGTCRQELGQMMANFSTELVGTYRHELDKVLARYIKSPYSEELHSRLGALELPDDAGTAGLLRFVAESCNSYNILSYRLVDLFEEAYRMTGSCIRIQREIRAQLGELRSSRVPGAAGPRHGGDAAQDAATYPAADGYAPAVEIEYHAVGRRGERADAAGSEYAYPQSFASVPEQYRRSSGVLARSDYPVPGAPERSADGGCGWSGSVPRRHEASPPRESWNSGWPAQDPSGCGRRGLGGSRVPGGDGGEPYPEYEVD